MKRPKYAEMMASLEKIAAQWDEGEWLSGPASSAIASSALGRPILLCCGPGDGGPGYKLREYLSGRVVPGSQQKTPWSQMPAGAARRCFESAMSLCDTPEAE